MNYGASHVALGVENWQKSVINESISLPRHDRMNDQARATEMMRDLLRFEDAILGKTHHMQINCKISQLLDIFTISKEIWG